MESAREYIRELGLAEEGHEENSFQNKTLGVTFAR